MGLYPPATAKEKLSEGMSGQTDLEQLIASMEPILSDEVYVFVTVTQDRIPPGLAPRMQFREAEGVTLIVTREEAVLHGLQAVFASRMITLNVHSSLEAVGFMAAISNALAAAKISVNPVSGFYHDHLFVPEAQAQNALSALHALSAPRGSAGH